MAIGETFKLIGFKDYLMKVRPFIIDGKLFDIAELSKNGEIVRFFSDKTLNHRSPHFYNDWNNNYYEPIFRIGNTRAYYGNW